VNKVPMKSSFPNPLDRFHRQRGMSLVESVIGLLVLTIVFLSGAEPLRTEATRSEVQSDLSKRIPKTE
jgi:type II secretory pathway pseudopilin PulG